MTIAQSLLAEFEAELPTTRRFLERVPDERLAWKPHEKSLSVGQLALHIAQLPKGVLAMALPDQGTPPDFARGFDPPPSTRAVLAALEASAAFVRATLPSIDDARMAKHFVIAMNGRTLLDVPRVQFLRSILLNHWYHHRGQLGVYLRLLGAKVPSSYGPSGDESPFS